jgi:hypothetical protein
MQISRPSAIVFSAFAKTFPDSKQLRPREALTRDIWMIYRDAIKAGGQVSREI